MTHAALAKAIGDYTPQMISYIFSGQRRPSYRKAKLILKVLGLPVTVSHLDVLLQGTPAEIEEVINNAGLRCQKTH